MEVLKQFLELAEKATPEPWHVTGSNGVTPSMIFQTEPNEKNCRNKLKRICLLGKLYACKKNDEGNTVRGKNVNQDGKFIAESRVLAPRMARALEAILKRIKHIETITPTYDSDTGHQFSLMKSEIQSIMEGK